MLATLKSPMLYLVTQRFPICIKLVPLQSNFGVQASAPVVSLDNLCVEVHSVQLLALQDIHSVPYFDVQALQEDDPCVEYVPDEQVEQLPAPAKLYFPAGQTVQDAEPVVL